jgi:hypothetical protein
MIDTSFLKKDDYIFGEIFSEYKDNSLNIFYIETHFVWDLLYNLKNINNDFVLVTHNSDHSVTREMSDFIESLPNLKMWFGQNIDCINKRIHSIPIGLENTKNWTKFSKMDLLHEASTKKVDPNNLVYANFSIWTNPNERNRCYEIVKNSNYITNKCLNNVVQDEYKNWLNECLDHHYVLCPRGHGIDTHRFWETLYLGRIPITIKNSNTRFYENLPVLYVDDWSEITEELLISKLEWFSTVSNFNLEPLKIGYWIDKIYSSIKINE